MYRGKRVAVIIPCFNEGEKLRRFLHDVPKYVDEILVVDDGSTDDTVSQAGRFAKVIPHNVRKGVGAAIRTALTYAKKNSFDVVVIMAGNSKDDPAEISKLLNPVVEQGYMWVQGSRFLRGGGHGNTPPYRLFAARILMPFFFLIVTHRHITEGSNGFRAIDLRILDDKRINFYSNWFNHYELETYFYAKMLKLGYKFREVGVKKIYPQSVSTTTKMMPILGWWSLLKPLFYMLLQIID